jgi:hypothetical protein
MTNPANPANPDPADDPRRRLIIQALSAGLSTAVLSNAHADSTALFGAKPHRLPANQSIFRMSGKVTINGTPATPTSRIVAGDALQVDADGELVFVVNANAMILRGDSELKIDARATSGGGSEPAVIGALHLMKGKLLSVSRFNPMRVHTVAANIAIGGTGFYIESDAARTYFCTCYGSTEVTATADPRVRITIESEHHDRPVYIMTKPADGKLIVSAPFVDHSDIELALIEALVGRTTPFAFPDDSYSAPRRSY